MAASAKHVENDQRQSEGSEAESGGSEVRAMSDNKTYWLDEPRNVTKIFYAVVALCALTYVPELVGLVSPEAGLHKHVHYDWEGWFGFHGWYGFVGCVMLVLVAKYVFRTLLMRKEGYYD